MSDKYTDVIVDKVTFYNSRGMNIQWSSISLGGYGEVAIFVEEDGKLYVDSEYMSPDFVKALLAKMVDSATF